MPSPLSRQLAAVLALLLAVLHWSTRGEVAGMGWDEAMHHAQPAARMATSLRELDLGSFADALHDCAQYPPLVPLCGALVEWPCGVSEDLLRFLGSLWFALAAWSAWRAGERLAGVVAGAGAFAVVAFSPLAWSYSGTLFLEGPFLALLLVALERVLARAQEDAGARADWWAGLAIAALPFAKWNYGLLAAAALLGAVLVHELRTPRAARLARLVRVALPLVLLFAWWFVLPLPYGFERAAEHRDAVLGFLAGNTDLAPVPWSARLLYASGELVRHPLALVLLVALVLLALGKPRTLPAWSLALLLVAPILAHPFHLDRFQLVWLAPLAPLAGAGCALLWSRWRWSPAVVLLLCAAPAGYAQERLAQALGVLSDKPEVRAYQLGTLEERARLFGGRATPTAGLPRAALDAVVDGIVVAGGPDTRIGWLGVSSELSPGTLNLELLAHGRSAQRFLEACEETIDLAYFGAERAVADEELRAWCAARDLVVWSVPGDFKERRERAWLAPVAARVPTLAPGVAAGQDGVLCRFELPRPLRAPLAVTMRGWRVAR